MPVVSALLFGLVLQGKTFAAVPQPWSNPGYLQVWWVDSPNFGRRPDSAVIDTVVVHHTANDSLEGTVKWFFNPESQVSAHYTIGQDGSIVQQVLTWQRAWHAGVSRDVEGRDNLNDFSIGIELVNIGDGKTPYPEAQLNALAFLIESLKRRHPLRYITSHRFVAQPAGRKPDPAGFPWQRLEGLGLKIVK